MQTLEKHEPAVFHVFFVFDKVLLHSLGFDWRYVVLSRGCFEKMWNICHWVDLFFSKTSSNVAVCLSRLIQT